MLSDEVTAALAKFFDEGRGPSHDEIGRLIDRAGLGTADPRREDSVAGKMKRIRAVLWHAAEHDAEAGGKVVGSLIAALRAAGSFRPSEANYPGESTVVSLQAALDSLGFDLSSDGVVRSKSMEGLEGAQMTGALWSYVRRARTAGEDSALRIGTAKELTEATARHVLIERIGSYPPHGNFPVTLFQAYTALGFTPPTREAMEVLQGDAWGCIEQAAFLLASAINRFRNEQGTGHGRPHPCLATEAQSRIAAEGSALVSELLLEGLAN
jgi:hypothetical protein